MSDFYKLQIINKLDLTLVGSKLELHTKTKFVEIMKKNDFGYCGLNCTTCKDRFTDIRSKIDALEEAFEKVNMKGMVKAIPFMNFRYKGYKKLIDFFKTECPGCKNNGGNPFCSIRKCSKKKNYSTCVECKTDMCSKYNTIMKVHIDNEIQNNRDIIKEFN